MISIQITFLMLLSLGCAGQIKEKTENLPVDTLEVYYNSFVFQSADGAFYNAIHYYDDEYDEGISIGLWNPGLDQMVNYVYNKKKNEVVPYVQRYINTNVSIDTLYDVGVLLGEDLTADTLFLDKRSYLITPRGEHDIRRSAEVSYFLRQLGGLDTTGDNLIQFLFRKTHRNSRKGAETLVEYCRLNLYVNRDSIYLDLTCKDAQGFDVTNDAKNTSVYLTKKRKVKELTRMLNKMDVSFSAYCLNYPHQDLIRVQMNGRTQQFFISLNDYNVTRDKRLKPVMQLHYLLTGIVNTYFKK